MENVKKNEMLISIFQGVERPNPIIDEENTDFDSVMNQSSFRKSNYCLSFMTFIYFVALCVIIIIGTNDAFNRDYEIVALIVLSIFCICIIVLHIMKLYTVFNFLRVTPINKKEFLSKLNELYNAKPKITLSGEVVGNTYTRYNYVNGLTYYRRTIIKSIDEDYSFNLCNDNTDTINLNSEFFRGKKFIVFYFQTKVTPGDPETTQDYEQRKSSLSEKLGNIENPKDNEKDTIVPEKQIKLKATIEGIINKEKCIVLSLDGSRPCWYGTCLYYLFTFCLFLPFVECLKSHILSVTAFKMVTISKVISINEHSNSLLDKEHNVVFPDDEIALVEFKNGENDNNNIAISINNGSF